MAAGAGREQVMNVNTTQLGGWGEGRDEGRRGRREKQGLGRGDGRGMQRCGFGLAGHDTVHSLYPPSLTTVHASLRWAVANDAIVVPLPYLPSPIHSLSHPFYSRTPVPFLTSLLLLLLIIHTSFITPLLISLTTMLGSH
jgi:hypothetical protein